MKPFKPKKYHNVESEAIVTVQAERQHYMVKNESKVVSTLLKSTDVGDSGFKKNKIVENSKKFVGIKTYKHDTSASRLGFGEVETTRKTVPVNRTSDNFWTAGQSKSPTRITQTFATSKEFSIGNHVASSPQAATGSAGKKMFDFGKNANSKNIVRQPAIVETPKKVPKV